MLVENQTDTCHPMVAHEISAGTAVEVWKQLPERQQKADGGRDLRAVHGSYKFFERMGIRVWPNGHGHTGVHHSIHSDYSSIPGYFDKMVAAYGEKRAKAILDENRHNTGYFPNLMIKGPIQAIRLFKPLAANRTLVESWTFRLVDAPDNAARAHPRLQPADQRADLGRSATTIWKCTSARRRAACGRQSVGQIRRLYDPPSRATDRGDQRHLGMADAQSVPRLVEIHDHVHA